MKAGDEISIEEFLKWLESQRKKVKKKENLSETYKELLYGVKLEDIKE